MKLKILLLPFIIAFFLIIGSKLIAQTSATANFSASVTIIQPIGITTTNNLNFSNIDAREGGTVVLNPDNTRLSLGSAQLKEGGDISAASFEITGQQGYAFAISLPKGQHTLGNGDSNIILQDFTTNYDGSALALGPQKINIGASLIVNPNQKPGFYNTSEDLQVTVNYN